MSRPAVSLEQSFTAGDYHRVAAFGDPDHWRTHAALGLCGNTVPALERLSGFQDGEAQFYEGVIRWIDGDDAGAIRLLARCDNAYADNLLRLVKKPRISVLAQLPWHRSPGAPHTLLQAGAMDPKFRIRNISFDGRDLANEPDADVHSFYDADDPPDMFVSEMIEWHVLPPNLQELPCPIIGHTADYDMHLQTIYPWLQVFDELVVTDSTEYADVAYMADAPTTTFCKPVSLPLRLLPEIDCERDLDLVVTGSLLHSYFPDKTVMMRQMLAADGLEPYFLSGFLHYSLYFPILARSKISVALTRHLGAIPTRGYEALAMGSVLLAPEESCMRLFADETQGVIPFSLSKEGLTKAIEALLGDYDRYAVGAREGMQRIRDAFDPWRVASQYFRMSTFLAARPRPPRKPAAIRPRQQRSIAYKGWLQGNERQTYQALRNASLERWKSTPVEDHTLDTICELPRELLLEYVHCTLSPDEHSYETLVQTALNIYRSALPLFPDSLALRFNFTRAAFHFGTEPDIEEALKVAEETLARDSATLSLDPLDNVMTWDYCQDFFNYRDYLQIATEAVRDRTDRSNELKSLILASLHYYFGRMSGAVGHYAKAAELDPEYSVYRLWQAKDCHQSDDLSTAASLLATVVRDILCAPEAWSLIQSIKSENGVAVPDEEALRRLVEKMEDRTLIDETYAAIRTGPYFRSQRLSLARNTGLEFRKKSDRTAPVRLSILLADTNGCRYSQLLASLKQQTLDRDAFEVIVCDVFDHVAPQLMEFADTVMVCGQSEHLYNRNAAFNFGLAEAKGDLVVFCADGDAFSETALADIATMAADCATRHTALVNAGGTDRETIHTLALSRDAAISAGGLDESPYFAGAYSGAYELASRLQGQRWTMRQIESVPSSSERRAETRRAMSNFIREIWPSKFSPYRSMPLFENPGIARLRQQGN